MNILMVYLCVFIFIRVIWVLVMYKVLFLRCYIKGILVFLFNIYMEYLKF